MWQPVVAIMFMSDNFFKKTDFININFVNFRLLYFTYEFHNFQNSILRLGVTLASSNGHDENSLLKPGSEKGLNVRCTVQDPASFSS